MVIYMVSNSEVPTPVKVLRCFVNNSTKGLTAKNVISTLDESSERIDKCLKKLLEKGLIRVEGSFYFYVETQSSLDLTQKLFNLYETIKKPPRDQIIKDLVLELYLKPFELENRLLEEGFSPKEIADVMENEVEKIIAEKTTSLEMTHYQYK